LAAQSITLQQQDRIVKIGHLDVEYYIISLKSAIHYPDQNGPAGVKAYFTDHQPSRGH
jgi:hypothetical protein